VAGGSSVYLHGFHGASPGAILQRAAVTKGAFFHYFASKTEFGYALVDEVLAHMITAQWVTPVHASADPLETISAEFERGIEVLAARRPILGCPLNNGLDSHPQPVGPALCRALEAGRFLRCTVHTMAA